MRKDDEPKKTKWEVGYRSGTAQQRCGLCTMYRSSRNDRGICTEVEGPIGPFDVCNIFERKAT